MTHTLPHCFLPELGIPYKGKVQWKFIAIRIN